MSASKITTAHCAQYHITDQAELLLNSSVVWAGNQPVLMGNSHIPKDNDFSMLKRKGTPSNNNKGIK